MFLAVSCPVTAADISRQLLIVLHVVASFVGIAAYATAAASGGMYLVARRELKSRHFGAVFRYFPSLATLDKANHLSTLTGFIGLTLGMLLASLYAVEAGMLTIPKVIWALIIWLALTGITIGRFVRGWEARKAATLSILTFIAVLALYVAFRVGSAGAA